MDWDGCISRRNKDWARTSRYMRTWMKESMTATCISW
ncbi:hypothetical protein [uncultured Acetatifactor sp.]